MIEDIVFSSLIEEPKSLTSTRKKIIHDSYMNYGREAIYNFAKSKKIIPFVAHSCIENDIEPEFWHKEHSYYWDRNLKVIELLNTVFKKLEEKGCKRVCVTENFASVLSSNACIGCFSSGDVDLFVDKSYLPIVDEVMDELGFKIGDRLKRKKCFAYEYYHEDIIGSKFWLNFQWTPLTRRKTHLYDQYCITQRLYRELDNTYKYKDTHINLLKPNAMLYFNLHHIASGHYYVMSPEFRLYADIDRPLRTLDIDLKEITNWVKEDRAGLRIAMPLFISNLFLETPCNLSDVMKDLDVNRFNRLKSYLLNDKDMTTRKPPQNIFGYLWYLTKIELYSDGTNIALALIRRIQGLFKEEL